MLPSNQKCPIKLFKVSATFTIIMLLLTGSSWFFGGHFKGLGCLFLGKIFGIYEDSMDFFDHKSKHFVHSTKCLQQEKTPNGIMILSLWTHANVFTLPPSDFFKMLSLAYMQIKFSSSWKLCLLKYGSTMLEVTTSG